MKTICPKCKKKQNSQHTYCEHCGALLHPQQFCERCGTLQQNGEKYCRKCGAPYPTVMPSDESVMKRPVKLWKSALVFFFIIVALGTFSFLKSRTNRPYASQLEQQYTEWKDSVSQERAKAAKKNKGGKKNAKSKNSQAKKK